MQYNFSLSGQEVDLIMKGLLELPAKESMKLILKLDQEANAQVKKAEHESKKNE